MSLSPRNEHASTVQWEKTAVSAPSVSLGCELKRNTLAELPKFLSSGCSHFQITIPGLVSTNAVDELSESANIVVHSNLLNTMGDNNWEELALPAMKVKQWNPKHVVEHFTLFRDSAGCKRGVYIANRNERKKILSIAIENILRWQDLVGRPIFIENVPATSEPAAYFEMYNEVVATTKCGVTIDLPHLVISSLAIKKDIFTFTEQVGLAEPTQVHVGGLSVTDGILRDNHNSFDLSLAEVTSHLFPNSKFVTIEQSSKVPNAVLLKWLMELNSKLKSNPPISTDLVKSKWQARQILDDERINFELAKDEVMTFGREMTPSIRSANAQIDIGDPLQYFEKYSSFYYPESSIRTFLRQKDNLNPTTAVKIVSQLARTSLDFSELWGGLSTFGYRISYGEGDAVVYSKIISRSLLESDELVESQDFVLKYKIGGSQWIGLQSIRFKHEENEPKQRRKS